MDIAGLKPRILVLTDFASVSVRVVISAVRDLGIQISDDDELLLITQAAVLGCKVPLETSSMDAVVSALKIPMFIEDRWLEEIGRVVKPGGKIIIQARFSSEEKSPSKLSSQLEHLVLMAGFIKFQALQEHNAFLPVEEGTHCFVIECEKAAWSVGASFPITKAKQPAKIQINDDESDLIDEDSLLTEEDMKKPTLPLVGDCEVGSTRKACKNCTCGRAEAEQKVEKLGLTAEQINNPQSACGSCGLGDAFRCGSCPYKGLPPFKLGEKVALPGNFLVADI